MRSRTPIKLETKISKYLGTDDELGQNESGILSLNYLRKDCIERVKLQIKQAEYLHLVGCKGQELISVSISAASSVSTL